MNPKYPIYIISKGRHESRYTSKALEKMRVPYHIVVEPQEYDDYASVIDPKKIYVLPFSNLGQGSIPARNWVWDHADNSGAKRHWIMDDNITRFLRRNNNLRIPVTSGTILRAAEDFTDRYENVPMSGLQYIFFAPDTSLRPAVAFNTRVYSCILLENNIDFRWRGRYNEDTDLSIRLLKAGYCTILFYAFLQEKTATMTMKGGNTDELYAEDGRLEMAKSLVEQHPDIAKITWKWGRWQHHVDYSSFRENKLMKKQDLVIPKRINNYGMILKKIK